MGSEAIDKEKAVNTCLAEISAAVMGTSLLRFSQHSGRSDATAEFTTVESGVFGHWMSLILIAGANLRLTFKVHYTHPVIRKMASGILGASATDAAVADFMREYCNLTGGAGKTLLEAKQVNMGLSLPLVTRAFDEVFFVPPAALVGSGNVVWKIASPEGEIHCLLTTTINDLQVVEQVALQPAQAMRVDLADEAVRVVGDRPDIGIRLFLPEIPAPGLGMGAIRGGSRFRAARKLRVAGEARGDELVAPAGVGGRPDDAGAVAGAGHGEAGGNGHRESRNPGKCQRSILIGPAGSA